MKRILYLTFYFRPDLCAGSFRNSPLVDELGEQSKNDDVKIEVFTTSPNRYSTFREEYQKNEKINNITIERIEVPSHQSGIKDQIFSFKTYFFETLKRTKNRKYDLVFASSSRFFTSYLGYWIAKRQKIPLYVDTRDLFSETLKGVTGHWFIKHIVAPIISKFEQQIYSYASHINLISEGFRENFPKKPDTSFSFYTHGVDPIFHTSGSLNGEYSEDSEKQIIYAGNIGDGQALHKIIPDAALKLESYYTFTIIGDGGARGKLEYKLKRLGVKNVELLEPVTREALVETYKNANILFIHLNDLNVFQKVLPSKIFELAVLEKPILAGVAGYARKFMRENVNGVYLFNPGDVDGLIEQIREIEKHFDNRQTIDNSHFFEMYNRKLINRKMAHSILKQL